MIFSGYLEFCVPANAGSCKRNDYTAAISYNKFTFAHRIASRLLQAQRRALTFQYLQNPLAKYKSAISCEFCYWQRLCSRAG